MKIVISHLNGNSNVRAAIRGFLKATILARFYTSVAIFPGSILDRLSWFSVFKRRKFDLEFKPFVRYWPWLEIPRLVIINIGLEKMITKKQHPFNLDVVNTNIDKQVASKLKSEIARGVKAVYCYEDTSLFSFREARRLGLKCFYDLPIGYWREGNRLLETELSRWPEWISTMDNFKLSEEALCRKDEELQLAHKVFVASSFTANTLKTYPGKLPPVEVIPYGFPPVSHRTRNSHNLHRQRALKLLFVGSLTQRKGIANLFAAAEQFRNYVSLTIVGRQTTNKCTALNTALVQHRWFPSLPNEQVLKLMGEQDVLIFPSLFEGFGLVITEAMSQGTPVITTDRTGGKDIIENGENGWLVEAGSTVALNGAIEDLLSRSQLIGRAGMAARETARLRPWEQYGKELAQAVQNAIVT